MKTSVIKMIFVLLVGISFSAAAQQVTEEPTTKKEIAEMDTVPKKTVWDKKFLIGITFDNAVSSIKGSNLPQDYFFRPGVGGGIKAEYYFTRNIGLTAGLVWETRGAGIITPDNVADLGDPDSTHRARIKFYSLETPVALVLRGFEPIKGTRLHAEIGVTLTRNIHSKYIFLSIEDGFHKVEDHSDRYYKTDMLIHAQFGLDINAAEACVFQVHFLGNWGTGNVYNQSAFPNADGQSRLYGIRLGWLF